MATPTKPDAQGAELEEIKLLLPILKELSPESDVKQVEELTALYSTDSDEVLVDDLKFIEITKPVVTKMIKMGLFTLKKDGPKAYEISPRCLEILGKSAQESDNPAESAPNPSIQNRPLNIPGRSKRPIAEHVVEDFLQDFPLLIVTGYLGKHEKVFETVIKGRAVIFLEQNAELQREKEEKEAGMKLPDLYTYISKL